MKKYLNKVKIVEPCDSVILSEIPILTALIYVTRFEKTDHVRATSEMHFVSPYHRYIHILIKTQ